MGPGTIGKITHPSGTMGKVNKVNDANPQTSNDDTDQVPEIDRSIVINDALKGLAQTSLRILLVVAVLFVTWHVLGQFWGGILPIILAIIICTVLAYPTSWMRTHGLPAALAALVSLALFLAGVAGVLLFVVPDVVNQSQLLYLQVFTGIQQFRVWLQESNFQLGSTDPDQIINDIIAWFQDRAGAIAGGIFSGISTATSAVITSFVILVLIFFFLKDGHKFLGWTRSVMGQRQGWHTTEVLTRAWNTLGGFIRAQAIVSAVDAFFIGVGLALIGVPMATALAVITFVAGFIPIVGAVSAGALAVIIALVSLGFTKAVLVLLLVIAVQQIEGNILSPVLQSRAMNLHPVIILVSVTVGGSMFGIVGAFLAVPVAAMIAVLFRYFQDVTMLRSGERGIDDITFLTAAGLAVGTINAEEGRQRRKELQQERRILKELPILKEPERSAKKPEKPSKRTRRPAPPAIRALGRKIAHTFHKKDE